MNMKTREERRARRKRIFGNLARLVGLVAGTMFGTSNIGRVITIGLVAAIGTLLLKLLF